MIYEFPWFWKQRPDKNSFPHGVIGFPPGVKGFPSGMRGFPLGVKGSPLEVRDFPLGENIFPLGENIFPLGVNGSPLGVNGSPLGVNGFPRGVNGLPPKGNHLPRCSNGFSRGRSFFLCIRGDLDCVFSIQTERVVSRDNTKCYTEDDLQIDRQHGDARWTAVASFVYRRIYDLLTKPDSFICN